MSVVQILIPKPIADELQLETIRQRARDAGIDKPTLEASTYRVPRAGHVRITCGPSMGRFLVEQLRVGPAASHDARLTVIAEIERELAAVIPATASVPVQRLGM